MIEMKGVIFPARIIWQPGAEQDKADRKDGFLKEAYTYIL